MSTVSPLQHHHALRNILTSLLLSTPPSLSADQLSSDLTMRHRMLSLPPTAPLAYDLVEHPLPAPTSASVSDNERAGSQTSFFAYLSRAPVELSLRAATPDIGARELFHRRIHAMGLAMEGERDPVDPREYSAWCRREWEPLGRFCVVFPRGQNETRLCMMLVSENDKDSKLDNLFAVDDWEEVVRQQGLHVWSVDCARNAKQEVSRGDEEEEAEQGGAEYIADADDFWAGYSDEEKEEQRQQAATLEPSHANTASSLISSQPDSQQQDAIRDIVRSAFTLYRTLNPHDAHQAFLELVRSAIAHS